uniref:Ester hydrolase C11orf54 homolog n=1 Tax=Hirondellea gigas TaxID=1518452 RepID=A0A2P2I8E8_9CRUS
MSLSVDTQQLFVPSLSEVCDTLQDGLSRNFETVKVEVVDCPDLTQSPFCLSGRGLCGSPRIADVGGPPYLLPHVDRTKLYDIANLTKLINLPNAFVVGAGAGPFPFVGQNSELMANVVTGKNASNGSRICKIINNKCELHKLPQNETGCALMINLFASEGLGGKVLKVSARKRKGTDNFISCIRKTLDVKYEDKSVGLGGFFRVTSGTVKCHVMPGFCDSALETEESLNNWLHFIDMPAPMTFFSVLVSRDPGMDLRQEHSHGYGESYGGHYHYDVTPDEVEYEGYFNIAEILYRIDRPEHTHSFRRD